MSKQIFEKRPELYIPKLAEELKKMPEFKAPPWMTFVKTGVSKQRVPENPDFWYLRAASILRQLYIKGVVGVSRLRRKYGGRKNRGVKPDKFRKASGKIIRVILQQGEKTGLIEKVKTRDQTGRRLTKKGKEFLDSVNV